MRTRWMSQGLRRSGDRRLSVIRMVNDMVLRVVQRQAVFAAEVIEQPVDIVSLPCTDQAFCRTLTIS